MRYIGTVVFALTLSFLAACSNDPASERQQAAASAGQIENAADDGGAAVGGVATAAAAEAAAPKPALTPPSGDYFLRYVPDLCTYLTQQRAAEVLGTQAMAMPGNGGKSSGGGVCNYYGMTNNNIVMSAHFQPLSIIDTSAMSADEVSAGIAMLYGNGDAPVPVSLGYGEAAFVFHNRITTTLAIVTAINSEAVSANGKRKQLTIMTSIDDEARDQEQRLAVLQELAEAEFAILDQAARTTHE